MNAIERQEFAGVPQMVKEARRFVSRTLVNAGVPREVIDGAVLAVSELATNAVEHSDSADFAVCVEVTPDEARVEVEDAGSAGPPAVRVACSPVDAESGRGLFLVNSVGVPYVRPRSDEAGRGVGVVIARPDAPAGASVAFSGAPSPEGVS